MIKKINILIIIISFFIVSACSKGIPPDDANIIAVKNYIKDRCEINKVADTNQDIILATIYFPTTQPTLSKSDKEILNKVATVTSNCNNKLLILGHASNYEKKQYGIKSANIAEERAKVIYDYLDTKIYKGQISFIFCDNVRNAYIENNSVAQNGNQRAEIIMLSNGYTNNYLVCLENPKKNEQ
ncbi:OmpA family protein [Rickettsiales bacterium LUAb2]